MDWEAVFKIIVAAIVSAGGAGAIIVACAKFIANHISEKMIKKYDAKLNKDLEFYKHELELETEKYRQKAEHLTFVTQRQFDTEFSAYQEIFDSLFSFSVHTAELYPMLDVIPPDEEEKRRMYRKRYSDYRKAFNRFSEVLEKNAPFIPKLHYETFVGLRSIAYELGCMYSEIRIQDDSLFAEDNRKIANENYMKTREFQDSIHEAKSTIREYLATLKVDRGL